MKKLISILCLALIITPAFAGIDQGIDKGMTHLSLLGGFAVPTSHFNTDGIIFGEKLEYGSAAGAYGLQLMHYLVPAFGLGIEIGGQNYSDAEQTIHKFGVGTAEQKTSSDLYQFMVAAKFNFAPAAKTRIYIPLGIGMAKYKLTDEITTEEFGVHKETRSESISSTKPSFYAGLGVETDLNDIFILGFEARYNGFWLDGDKFEGAINDEKTSYLSNVNLMLKLGFKF